MAREILAVGWDVGGWRGRKQAVAVCRAGQGKPQWLGSQVRFKIADLQKEGGTLDALVRLAWPEAPHDLQDRYRLVLAIDSPLGFPRAFVDLLNGQSPVIPPDRKEIENPLAYRETDRQVYKAFKKKPLSASFDRLGNNATVAVTYARRWRQKSPARIVPLDSADTRRPVIIEVYPALAKQPKGRRCYPRLRQLLPVRLQPNSDQYDATICAVLALAFGVNRRWLPRLVGPPAHFSRTAARMEGWIYHAPLRWLRHE